MFGGAVLGAVITAIVLVIFLEKITVVRKRYVLLYNFYIIPQTYILKQQTLRNYLSLT